MSLFVCLSSFLFAASLIRLLYLFILSFMTIYSQCQNKLPNNTSSQIETKKKLFIFCINLPYNLILIQMYANIQMQHESINLNFMNRDGILTTLLYLFAAKEVHLPIICTSILLAGICCYYCCYCEDFVKTCKITLQFSVIPNKTFAGKSCYLYCR